MLNASFLTKFDWSTEELAKEEISLDLGLHHPTFSFEDVVRFQVLGNVLDTLCSKAPNCKKIILYTGPLLWAQEAFFTPSLEKRYQEWMVDLGIQEDSFEKRGIFQVNVLMEYLHRVASFAPDTLLFSVKFTDTDRIQKPYLAQLFSKRRFTHFLIEQEPFEGDVGFILPDDEKIDAITYKHIEQVLEKYQGRVRFLPEKMIPELWTGLTTLYAEKAKLTRFGLRGLLGFEAAEGEVVSLENL